MANKINYKFISLGIGIILLISLAMFGQRFSIDDLAGGATVFSIDTVQSSSDGDNTEWVISLSMNDGAEKVTGEITPDQISKFNLQAVPQESFVIDFELSDVQCNYDVEATNKVVGKIYNAQIDEQCLGFPCPYDYIDLDDVIQKCVNNGGENCDRMVDLVSLGFGTHTEWCSWMPEESNVANDFECQNLVDGNQVVCRIKEPYLEGCGVCEGWDCNQNILDSLPSTWTSEVIDNREERGIYTGEHYNLLCCFNSGMVTGVAVDNGDWNVQSMGIVPDYQVQEIQTTPMTSYKGKVVVTFADGTKYEAVIDEKTKIAELGELGNVKWVGNLIGTQFCPQPAINTGLLKDLSTGEYKAVSSGAGSNYQSYLDTLNELTRTDADHFTFTLVSPTSVTAIDPAVGGDIIYTSYTKLNSLFGDLDNENKLSDCKFSTLNNRYECVTQTPVVLPLLKLTIKSSEVGIFIPDGKPEIVAFSTTSNKATTPDYFEKIVLNPSELTKLYVGIKNIGSEDDSFDVSIDCPFPVSQQSDRIVVASGLVDVAELLVSGDGLIQSCNIRANSVSYPDNRDEADLDVVINPTCDQYGINQADMIFTEYGCFSQTLYPETPCTNSEFWLDNLRKCVAYDSLKTVEQRVAILEKVAQEDCSRQCNGNKECTLYCLDNGNVKPVCTGIKEMMTLNDYLCDFEKQPNLLLPSKLQNKMWIDAPICNYICEWGYTGTDCLEVNNDVKFVYGTRPPLATLKKGSEQCESCFDGVKNQNEEDIDCGGICVENYGRDMDCGKLRPPEHCYNNIVDGDEYCVLNDCLAEFGADKSDCGGSCQFTCDEKANVFTSGVFEDNKGTLYIVGVVLFALISVLGYVKYKKK